MVRTTMDVDINNVSIHGWANNENGTTSCLPSNFYHAIPAQVLVSGYLPNELQTPKDNIRCLHPKESLALAALRETKSFHPQVPVGEEEAKHVVLDRCERRQIRALDLRLPNCVFHL